MGEHGVVASKEHNLIDQIEQDALDDEVPVATALRKCLILGGKSGSEELRDWATRELRGYLAEDDLPSYRIVPAPLRIDGIAGNYKVSRQAFPPTGLPDFAREHIKDEVQFREGVGAIEALLNMDEIKLSPPMASDLVRYMNSDNASPYQHIESLYWQVSHSAVRGLLDQVRTSLTQFVAELRATTGNSSETPTAAVTDQALNVVVTGKRSKVQINSAQASGQQSVASAATDAPVPAEAGFWTRSRRIGAFLVGAATIAAAVFGAIEVY
jgi:hypothetical protein